MSAEVLYSYSPTEDDELTVEKGEFVEIINRSEDDWWKCRHSSGSEGMLPANYLKIVSNEDVSNSVAEGSLPNGWVVLQDPETDTPYYYEESSGITQWDPPVIEESTPAQVIPQDISGKVTSSLEPRLPMGWEKFIDDETGDAYYHNAETDETTWDFPVANNQPSDASDEKIYKESKKSALKSVLRSATEDLSDLQQLRLEADSKMNALRDALDAQQKEKVVHQQKSPQKSNKKRKSNESQQSLGQLSIDEINRLIEERVAQELLKREEVILERVKHMLGSQIDNGNNSSRTQKQKKRDAVVATSSTKLPTISRSAESKTKNPSLLRPSDEGRIYESPKQDFVVGDPESDPNFASLPPHNKKSLQAPTDEMFTPLKPLDLAIPSSNKYSGMRSGRKDPNSSPIGSKDRNNNEAMFPAIVKPQKASVNLAVENDIYEDFSAPVDHVVDEADEVGSQVSVVRKDEARGTLRLEHVHGYDGDFTRHGGTRGGGKNIIWLTEDVITYPAATLVVLMNINTKQQMFYSAHTDEVSCLTVHPDRTIMASGQMGKSGRVLVWDAGAIVNPAPNNAQDRDVRNSPRYEPLPDPSNNFIMEMNLENKLKGIIGVNFSGDGVLLVALGLDENKSIFVIRWDKSEILASVKLGHVDVFQMGFNPFLFVSPSTQDDGPSPTRKKNKDHGNECCYTLVSCGTRYVKFWVLRHVRERTDVSAIAANGSQFKGRKIAIPKSKQQWTWKYVLEGNVGLFPKKNGNSPPDMMCFCAIPEQSEAGCLPRSRILTGGSNGSVYIWQHLESSPDTARGDGTLYWSPRGKLLCVVTEVHDGPLYDLDYFTTEADDERSGAGNLHRVVTCGKDGMMNIWSLDSSNPSGDLSPMEHIGSVNVSSHSVSTGLPRSTSWGFDGESVIIGTTSNTLCMATGKGLHCANMRSHDEASEVDIRLDAIVNGNVGRVKRVYPHPFLDIFATIATDKTIRIWSSQTNSQMALTRVASCATAITFTPDGGAIAVGTEVGEVLILTCTYLQNCSEMSAEPSPSKKKARWELLGRKFVGTKMKGKDGSKKNNSMCEVTDMRYSPGGEILAVAVRDKTIHLLTPPNGYKRIASCRGHSGGIVRLDFSDDGTILQSTDGLRETLYWEIPVGKQLSGSRVKGVTWCTWSNPLGNPVKGILNGPTGGSDNAHGNREAANPNAAELCHISSVHRSNDTNSLLVALGGSGGVVPRNLKLFKYPCTSSAIAKEYSGHAASVTDATFLASDSVVISGGGDSCVFCWKHTL